MGKETEAGIDVSKSTLDVAVRRSGQRLESARFANDAAGHRALIRWLTKRGAHARVVLEATGIYSLDLSMALHAARGVQVMVANPRAVKQFAGALMQRAKTDLTAAVALREFALRMPFVAWQPPAAEVLALRGFARRIASLVAERTREHNRLHALQATAATPAGLVADVEDSLAQLERRLNRLATDAAALIAAHAPLRTAYARLVSVPGIAAHSAIQLLPELLVLPSDMTVRQWVAHAGLDPRPHQSGTSVDKPARLSKVGNAHLRRALYMPALVAVRFNAHVRAFFDKLIARGKRPLQAYVAVMRKLLHAIYGMLATDTDFRGELFHAA